MLKTTRSELTILAVPYEFLTSAELAHEARSTSWNQASTAVFTAACDLWPASFATKLTRVLRAITRKV